MEENLTATSSSSGAIDAVTDFAGRPDAWILIAGPSLVFLIIFFVIIALKRRSKIREEADVTQALAGEPAGDPTSVVTPARPTPPTPAEVGESWLQRLHAGLNKTRESLTQNLSAIFSGTVSLDKSVLDRLHEVLFRADIGVHVADDLIASIKKSLGSQEKTDYAAVAAVIRARMIEIFSGSQKPLNQPVAGPFVILVVGVNGVGKTTTIGKLSSYYQSQGKKVLLCAADTYRAAAIEQLQAWGERVGADVICQQAGGDPAAVAYDAVKAAMARQVDILLIDTAGRLHSKVELMDELAKIKRIVGRDLPGAPHECWLVLDATTGQNAVSQVKAFREVTDVSGLVVTKLDGTAKGGVVVGISAQHQIPIRFIGVGEKVSDLREFSANDFVESLL